ncbi:hypothetical protein LQU94_04135 [Peptoniphilus sp. KCTC 25270]|uniref:hypothetical protein n=1 Tax=Peptoniphilus sp. KCTC 25270 TaxID=2897414 RepID=UPI001E34E62A|nr:hypothetical protein [Peptoniphilus sp. KCTC 25270]MCD1147295.1 hypothetical protein [Peptoniphilus sp. KCTC 25270]
MELIEFNRKVIELTDINENKYVGTVYYCDKEDYEAEEDGLEMRVRKDIWIFYESDIQSIKILD